MFYSFFNKTISSQITPPTSKMVKVFKKQYEIMKKKDWKKIYVAVDIHETIMVPTWSSELSNQYYPYAIDSLQLMSKRDDLCLILLTCSTQSNIDQYLNEFKSKNINFRYVNCNPEIENTTFANFTDKFYINVGLDDKFGFEPSEWEHIYKYFNELPN